MLGHMIRVITIIAFALILVGCGGTYVDDKHNFERALQFSRPNDVQVVHSVYWQSAHFTDEHCFYLELLPAAGSSIFKTLTTTNDIALMTDEQQEILPSLILERPKWFAPKSRESYEVWASTNQFTQFGLLRDKSDGRLFVYGQIL